MSSCFQELDEYNDCQQIVRCRSVGQLKQFQSVTKQQDLKLKKARRGESVAKSLTSSQDTFLSEEKIEDFLVMSVDNCNFCNDTCGQDLFRFQEQLKTTENKPKIIGQLLQKEKKKLEDQFSYPKNPVLNKREIKLESVDSFCQARRLANNSRQKNRYRKLTIDNSLDVWVHGLNKVINQSDDQVTTEKLISFLHLIDLKNITDTERKIIYNQALADNILTKNLQVRLKQQIESNSQQSKTIQSKKNQLQPTRHGSTNYREFRRALLTGNSTEVGAQKNYDSIYGFIDHSKMLNAGYSQQNDLQSWINQDLIQRLRYQNSKELLQILNSQPALMTPAQLQQDQNLKQKKKMLLQEYHQRFNQIYSDELCQQKVTMRIFNLSLSQDGQKSDEMQLLQQILKVEKEIQNFQLALNKMALNYENQFRKKMDQIEMITDQAQKVGNQSQRDSVQEQIKNKSPLKKMVNVNQKIHQHRSSQQEMVKRLLKRIPTDRNLLNRQKLQAALSSNDYNTAVRDRKQNIKKQNQRQLRGYEKCLNELSTRHKKPQTIKLLELCKLHLQTGWPIDQNEFDKMRQISGLEDQQKIIARNLNLIH